MKLFSLKMLSLALLMGIMVGCKKEKMEPDEVLTEIDYRLQYVGNYHFTRFSSNWIYTQGNTDTTIYFDGVIALGTTDSSVIIPTSPDDEIEMVVDGNGEFTGCLQCSSDFHYSRRGDFHSDSVELYIGYHGLGSIWHWDISGERY